MSSHTDSINPQNPYVSAMVSASAGSGKTYQLSRRFLGLVAAGASPASILAVTFSKKAAGEMRERIVRDAIALGQGSQEFSGFYEQLVGWRAASIRQGLTLPPLLTPKQVSDQITHSSQSLSITTIDAILMEWCLRFPWETRITQGDATLMQPWDIATRDETQKLTREAWKNAILRILETQESFEGRLELLDQILMAAPEEQLTVAWTRISPLRNSETFIWLCEHLRGSAALKYSDSSQDIPDSEAELIDHLADDLRVIVDLLSNADKKSAAYAALGERSFEQLIRSGLFTHAYQLHKGTVSKKICAALPEIINRVDELAGQFRDTKRISQLNSHGELLWQLYRAWTRENLAAKSRMARGTFADALKGVWQLFCDGNPGARWMIQHRVKHLLLDEFQDTSRLQWGAFSELARDIIAGKSTEQDILPGTVFIVGDAKQSIYGFREAAPEIMDLAAIELKPHGFNRIEMSASWRTSPVILDVVNHVFADRTLIPEFPIHKTAAVGERLAVPDFGSVTVLAVPEHTGDKDINKEHVSLEASSVTGYIQKCLAGEIHCPIWDKTQQQFRNPRPTDFAILYHAKTDADAYEDALRQQRIPAMREEKKGFYDRQEIRDTIAFLKWLAWPEDTLALCTMLKSPVCGITDIQLQTLLMPSDGGEYITTLLMMQRLRQMNPRLWRLLQDAQTQAHQKPYMSILLWWFKATHILAVYKQAFGALEGEMAAANLLKFIDTIRACESGGHGHLQSVIEQFDLWSEEDETGNASTSADAVHLMTIHKSKGLEFPVVILVGTANDWFRSDHYWLRSIVSGAEGLSYVGTSADQPQNNAEFNERREENEATVRAEKARLLYVAMTRSQFHLVVSSGFKPTKALPEPPAESFYSRIQQATLATGGEVSELGIRLNRSHLNQKSELVLSATSASTSEVSSQEIASTSNLNTTLPPLFILTATAKASSNVDHQAPQGSYEAALQKNSGSEVALPPKIQPKHAVAYGKCLHRVLELSLGHHRQMQAPKELARWMKHRMEEGKLLTSADLEEIARLAIQDASQCMISVAWQTIFNHAKHAFQEFSLVNIVTSPQGLQNLVVGQPDLVIEKNDGSIWVVDYKTGFVSGDVNPLIYCQQRGYDIQVQTYASTLQQIYPGRVVKSWILLTQTSLLVEIPNEMPQTLKK